MNECLFIGRFTETPSVQEIKLGENMVKVVNFTLAIPRKFKKGDNTVGKQTVFLDFEAWDSGAEVIAKHFIKGQQILIYASARNDIYTSSTGIKHHKIKFRVEKFEFISGETREEESNG